MEYQFDYVHLTGIVWKSLWCDLWFSEYSVILLNLRTFKNGREKHVSCFVNTQQLVLDVSPYVCPEIFEWCNFLNVSGSEL
jgi:hypothetical protein